MSNEKSPQFGRVPYAVIDAGKVAELKPAAAKVYLVLLSHVDEYWQASVGMRRIARLTGLQLGSVSRSVGQLRDAGLIAAKAEGNGHAMSYRIAISIPADRSPASERPTVHRGVNGREGDRLPVGGETVHPVAQNRSPGGERNRENRERTDTARTANASVANEFSFPLRGSGVWQLPAGRLTECRDTFPGVDVPAELRKARLWLCDHPDRRKTAKGMPRFLSGWLGRAKPGDADNTHTRRTTSWELDAICPLVEPTDEDFAWMEEQHTMKHEVTP